MEPNGFAKKGETNPDESNTNFTTLRDDGLRIREGWVR